MKDLKRTATYKEAVKWAWLLTEARHKADMKRAEQILLFGKELNSMQNNAQLALKHSKQPNNNPLRDILKN